VTASFNGIELVAGRTHQTDVTLKAMKQARWFGGAIAVPPQPLRSLYEDSSLVVVGKPVKSSTVSRDEDSSLIRTSVEITEMLKGKSRKSTIQVYHEQRQEAGTDAFPEGAPLLMFLNRRKSGGVLRNSAYEPAHFGQPIKQLPESDLASYVSRIRSLQAILQAQKPCRGDLAEWLVQTVAGGYYFGPAAVIQGNRELQACAVTRLLAGPLYFTHHDRLQTFFATDGLKPYVVPLQGIKFLAQELFQKGHQRVDFKSGPFPVLGREGIQREIRYAEPGSRFYGGANRLRPRPVTGDPGLVAPGSPTAIAIHYDGNVRW